MESATSAANGFRFRVPYGTLLCVGDKPLHGEIKLPGMVNTLYREPVDQHLRISMLAAELLRQERPGSLHSRKLRSFWKGRFIRLGVLVNRGRAMSTQRVWLRFVAALMWRTIGLTVSRQSPHRSVFFLTVPRFRQQGALSTRGQVMALR
jgi:hypothetical protein